MLEELTLVSVIGVLFWFEYGLFEEDGVGPLVLQLGWECVAVVPYPTASNLDEFCLLEQVAQVVWAQTATELDGVVLVILLGLKHVVRDLVWFCHSGLDAVIIVRVGRGERVLAICGGLQLFGERIDDPHN